MQKTLFAFLILVFSVQSCMKKDCTIRDPFTSNEIANYKCKSDCKTDAEILSSVQCVRCVSQLLDTVETCSRIDGDSLIQFYLNNPTAGHCDKIEAKLDCGK